VPCQSTETDFSGVNQAFHLASLSLVVCAILFTPSLFNDTIPEVQLIKCLNERIPKDAAVLTTEQHWRQREGWGSLKIGMVGRHNTRHNLVRVLSLTLAALSVLFLAQVLSHSHAKGQNETTCQVCQAAHLGPAPTAGTASLVTPLLSTGRVQPFVLVFHQEFFSYGSPSRAPPTA